jgi:hypothetical protein
MLPFLLAMHGLVLGEPDGGVAAYKQGDYDTALQEWRPLAEGGDPGAQLNLGLMYVNGHGVPRDYREAIKWYRRAAEQGSDRAQYNLGLMYDHGYGVPQDYVFAHMWYNIAGTAGSAVAITYRDLLAREMTTAQLAEAQMLAREWIGSHPVCLAGQNGACLDAPYPESSILSLFAIPASGN